MKIWILKFIELFWKFETTEPSPYGGWMQTTNDNFHQKILNFLKFNFSSSVLESAWEKYYMSSNKRNSNQWLLR